LRTKRTLTNAQLWGQMHRVGGATVGLGVVIGITDLCSRTPRLAA
jgi:hypothetical protein